MSRTKLQHNEIQLYDKKLKKYYWKSVDPDVFDRINYLVTKARKAKKEVSDDTKSE